MSETLKRTMSGVISSDKMDKAVTVRIERRVPHPIYKKYVKKTTKIHARDPENKGKLGDKVTIRASRPISKTISWVLASIDERAPS